MATKSSITKQTFEKLLEEQKEQEILKWGELEEDLIYEIVNYEFIETSNGKSCVIILSDDNRVWSPLALTNRAGNFDMSNFFSLGRNEKTTLPIQIHPDYTLFQLVILNQKILARNTFWH